MRQLGSAQEGQVWDWGSLNVNGPLSSQRMGAEGLLCASPYNHPGDGEEGLFVSPLPCNHPGREVTMRNVLKPSLENSWPFRLFLFLTVQDSGLPLCWGSGAADMAKIWAQAPPLHCGLLWETDHLPSYHLTPWAPRSLV